MHKISTISSFFSKIFLLLMLSTQTSQANDFTMFYTIFSSKLVKRMVIPTMLLGLNLYFLNRAESSIIKNEKNQDLLANKLRDLFCNRKYLTQECFDKKYAALNKELISCQSTQTMNRFFKFVCRLLAPFLWMMLFALLFNAIYSNDLIALGKIQQEQYSQSEHRAESRFDGLGQRLEACERVLNSLSQSLDALVAMQEANQGVCGIPSARRRASF